MKLVLLSGGSGKRLWPLSNDARSKQFLKVLEDERHQLVSMVQRVWGQITERGLGDISFIATGKSQMEMMHNQIGRHVPLIIEPERRDTFAAIALTAAYLYSEQEAGLDEVIAILPVDPYVEGRFFDEVKQLEAVLNDSGANLALIGVKPTYPSSKYGYIVPSASGRQNDSGYRQVNRFEEKPSEERAGRLIEQYDALWNCGVFAFKLGFLIGILEQKGLPLHYKELVRQYHTLPKVSFDYEVVERTEHIVVRPYEGYWKDLGTWNTLTEEMGNRLIGKGMISEDSVNTHLINEIDIPVSILGLSNVVVAVSPDGILVADKSASPRVKDFINYNQGPMFEERSWGWARILDDQRYDDGRLVVTKRVGILQGRNISYQLHINREEVWTIVKGEGEFIQNGNYMRVKAGNVLHIPMKTLHSIRAESELEIIIVQSGNGDEDSRLVELYNTWEEVEEHCTNM
ncbi:sugar phosphate nucleotidyltransferase [Paenibacillus sp. ATY16]|uniref:sugar phosphate nucleotidyltransferase n=1 Tax=Paenibacillus sp. ATY16 TaxID=1759312 RepID=UPI00200D9E82|nr:sugar phosphate nucleotidyltransferase [Paenibacillus sp. ATY16]MCK9860355.1 sugar phosphate nucleotidyltransferase [Paenibacillus sp. ATY16]